ncbi:GntR family transcriptional regulator [Amycolatopsis acidicola]|uniref:GntR family transcriptional regulator n=1 Tax=Amycolatopsis acidicola TaxID=2596893 RepID=A0A5N0UQX1_9PSEU|nr:GntR family transcriptional regulator [Amycolatopsis acidicola]KAA9153478.1 GntR family transcriptional regulator [Amycolatopsis acidicola]
MPNTPPVIPLSLRKQDWAYRQLRERILTGRLTPGEQLSQEGLATELGISRGPLRDALSRLASEHLVVDRPHQKWMVADVSAADARDIYNGRAALESMLGAAATQASAARREACYGQLAELLDGQRAAAAAAADLTELRALDRRFHDAIYRLADMPASMAALNHLRAKSDRYIALYLADSGRAHTSLEEHAGILDALRAGEAEQSAALTRAHVLGGLGPLIGSLDREPANLTETP